MGDLHGNFDYLRYIIKISQDKYRNTVIIQTGDFGVGFIKYQRQANVLGEFNKFLKLYNIVMYCIAGNHDDRSYFDGKFVLSNLKLMPDYSVLEIEGSRILLIGGAISVDRTDRKLNESYWINEKFVLDKEKIGKLENIDIVATHTAPDFCRPFNTLGFGELVNHYSKQDEFLKHELTLERQSLTEMWNLLKEKNKVEYYFYSHFHSSYSMFYDNCRFVLLDTNEMYDHKGKDYENELNELYK
jgi:DNA repair exonuclease SbcCD nuclease subunit